MMTPALQIMAIPINTMTRMMKEKRSIMFFWLGIMGLVFLY